MSEQDDAYEQEIPAMTPGPATKEKKKVTKTKTAKAPKAGKKATKAVPARKPSGNGVAVKAKGVTRTQGLARHRPVAELLKSVSDPTRLGVMTTLLEIGPHNVGEICRAMGNISQPAISHHLALLRHSRLITPRREGKNNYYELTPAGTSLVKGIKGLYVD